MLWCLPRVTIRLLNLNPLYNLVLFNDDVEVQLPGDGVVIDAAEECVETEQYKLDVGGVDGVCAILLDGVEDGDVGEVVEEVPSSRWE